METNKSESNCIDVEHNKDEILKEIKELRKQLHDLVREEGEKFVDSEVVKLSEKLDKALNLYYKKEYGDK
ncbi:aspartyl-phosphate phosphatase Spo0E family protein [Proteinivorax tanatarense]|uniref:Aspartyl-phosphate phosphatase Spo0E family protein n=1 Tax=Proteinivorax tanatarense TaxID=1260629 RepID=A0AAU7VPN6_9FIRM